MLPLGTTRPRPDLAGATGNSQASKSHRRKPALPNFTFSVEASHILMFARAIGDESPVYHDAETAKHSEPGGIIAPPTFTAASAQFNPEGSRPRPGQKWFGSGKGPSGIDGKPPSAGGLNAEQHFEYFRPLRPGDVLTVETRPGTTWERHSKRAGKLMFSDRITDFRDQDGELVVSVRSVSVKTERPVDPA
jgi:acyl dehydratase